MHGMSCDDTKPGGTKIAGVYGRPSGEVAAFGYSSALKQAHIVWDDASLEQWLADPDALVPSNNMEFHIAKPQERRDLIVFSKRMRASRASGAFLCSANRLFCGSEVSRVRTGGVCLSAPSANNRQLAANLNLR
jgi:hypothetical protein